MADLRCPHNIAAPGCAFCHRPPAPPARPERPARPTAPRGDSSRFTRGAIDMTGQRIGQVEITGRAANVNGNARWRYSCSCGGRGVADGIQLRAAKKNGVDFCCPACHDKRRGARRANA